MKLVRAVVFTVSLVLLGAGYAISQRTLLNSPTAYGDYLAQVDSPVVRMSALALLALCVVFPFLGRTEEDATQ